MRRILRSIIADEEYSPGFLILKLECGHEIGPVSNQQQRPLPRRKHCRCCELVAEFRQKNGRVYGRLKRLLNDVPPDDRAMTLIEWILHLHEMEVSLMRLDGLDPAIGMALTQEPMSYPLADRFYDDEDDEEVDAGA